LKRTATRYDKLARNFRDLPPRRPILVGTIDVAVASDRATSAFTINRDKLREMRRRKGRSAAIVGTGLFRQYITNHQDQITAELIRRFPARIFDSVVTGIVSELPILEFAISILNDLCSDFSAKEIIESLGLGLIARINYQGTAIFDGTAGDCLFDAIAHSRQC
jgi:hypothetical protein